MGSVGGRPYGDAALAIGSVGGRPYGEAALAMGSLPRAKGDAARVIGSGPPGYMEVS